MNFLGSREVSAEEMEVQNGFEALAEELNWGGSVHSPVKEVKGSNLSTANAAKPTELVSEECAVDSHALCNPHISIDVDFALVSGPGFHRILDAESHEVENPYAAPRDELRSNLAQSTINAHISPENVQRSTGDDREVGCSESTECQIAENSKEEVFAILWRRSASSPETQKKRGWMGLEGVDSSPIAPFRYLHEER
ncbi:hypothetical protein M0R45_035750 [Rubus argutus]|uniref:Uncharacterized protein n=1 Tax=Rubus argutus TaxID=59490 RepID=A0AAW1VWY7_RUBAR